MGMNLDLENLQELKELATLLQAFQPAITEFDNAVAGYGPLIRNRLGTIAIGMADMKADAFDHLVKERGLTREEALVMVSDQWAKVFEIMQSQKKKS